MTVSVKSGAAEVGNTQGVFQCQAGGQLKHSAVYQSFLYKCAPISAEIYACAGMKINAELQNEAPRGLPGVFPLACSFCTSV